MSGTAFCASSSSSLSLLPWEGLCFCSRALQGAWCLQPAEAGPHSAVGRPQSWLPGNRSRHLGINWESLAFKTVHLRSSASEALTAARRGSPQRGPRHSTRLRGSMWPLRRLQLPSSLREDPPPHPPQPQRPDMTSGHCVTREPHLLFINNCDLPLGRRFLEPLALSFDGCVYTPKPISETASMQEAPPWL